MNGLFFKALVLALVIHGAFFLVGRRAVFPVSGETGLSGPIVLEGGDGLVGGNGSGAKARAARPKQDLSFSWRDVFSGEASAEAPVGKPSAQEVSNRLGRRSWEFGQSLDLEKTARYQKFFGALWRRLDHSIGYPDDFAHERIEGVVTARALIGRDGVIAGETLEVGSASQELELYVAAIVSAVLLNPLPERYWAEEESVPVNFVVQFQVHTDRSSAMNDLGGVAGNTLTLRRHTRLEGKVNEALQAFYKRFVPPIIVWPGGFMVDFVHLYEMIDEWGKPTPGELRAYRMEVFKRYLRYEAGKRAIPE